MKNITIDAHNYLAFSDTPWDTKVFGFNTNELLKIEYQTQSDLAALLKQFDENNINKDKVKFTYTRIDSNDKLLKKMLQQFGFYYAETSFDISMNNLQRNNFEDFIRSDFTLEVPLASDFPKIRKIAQEDFNFSRFHEDHHIDIEKARLRYYCWIDELLNQDKKFLVYKYAQEVVSFLAYSVENDCVDLILGGSTANRGWVSYYFYAAFMNYFKDLRITKAKTTISASNIGIVNVYSKLGFTFERALIGFHKLY